MWWQGKLAVPTLWKAGLALVRVTYDMIPEPEHVKKFRERFEFGALEHFSWVPQSGDPEQVLFVRRRYNSEYRSFDLELIIWSRLEDSFQHVFLDGKTFNTMLALLSDMKAHPNDSRATALIKQDRKFVAARTVEPNEKGESWFQADGEWLRQENAYVRERRRVTAEAKTAKGGDPNVRRQENPASPG